MAGSELKADLWVNEYITPWDIYSHGVSRILAYKKTAFQEMYIVESGAYGKALVLDGKWQSCTGDEFIYHEALVQPAMIAHQEPKTALILGGGEGATTRELLRWKTIEKVMMIDIDGDVVEACKEHLPEMHQGTFDDPRFELVVADALEVLDTTNDQWDIIISDLVDPIEEVLLSPYSRKNTLKNYKEFCRKWHCCCPIWPGFSSFGDVSCAFGEYFKSSFSLRSFLLRSHS